jgi:hypothetical protein
LPGARSKPAKRTKKLLSEENVLALGRKHFSEDFPNPERRGCPPTDQLKSLADNPRKATESTLNHISSCSPCYRDYSRFLRKRKATLRSKPPRRK